MIPSALWAIYFHEWSVLRAFVLAMLVSLAVGAALTQIGKRASDHMYQREALAMVGVSWLVAAALGALPYVFADVLGPVDAYFESMSGFTTTGSSVLTDIEGTYKGILFWRSFTHWLGGMGIIVLFIAVLPYLGAGGKLLFKSESPGPEPRGLRPRIQDTASILYIIYGGLTVLETVALMWAGMDLFDALCHTFGTLATGGFSTRQASIGAFNSVAVDTIIILFMVCAGANFALYFAMLRGNWKAPWRDTEWRVYMALLILCTGAVTLNLLGLEHYSPIASTAQEATHVAIQNDANEEATDVTLTSSNGETRVLGDLDRAETVSVDLRAFGERTYQLAYRLGGVAHVAASPAVAPTCRRTAATIASDGRVDWRPVPDYSPSQAVRYAAFQVASIMTTTGYCTADFDGWPHFSRMLLLVLMFVGGCAGSTGGGMKVVRIIILAKMTYWRLESTFRPKMVRAIRLSGEVIDDDTRRRVYAFFVLYLAWFVVGALFMSLLGLPFQTAVTAVAATLNNIGPGLEAVGATMDYHLVPAVGKVFLALCMVLGRLELFSICVLLVPAFWRNR